ncbi:Alpha/Beta hydrolase protein [Flammula alnicola]|nr:Alpha/Beta hydrolase protein [Flammula alnicola]
MPVPEPSKQPSPRLHHLTLSTTFCGLEHPLSTPDTPIHQYRGIKYASVPARFRQSQLCTSYPPITDATEHGPICPQIQAAKSAEEMLFGIPQEEIPIQDFKQDEFECLNLNITCPGGLNSRSRMPVMLWVHGGGDRGSGSEWFYDGGALVRKSLAYKKPVIVVTFNFRIGLLGFATNPLIRDDNKAAGEEGTGNYGLRDQRRAMEWLHSYIGEFGGDPNNITLFGAGSGGADIVLHLLSRANEEQQPLFHRAIVQSAIFEPILPDVNSAGWHLSRVMSALQISTIEKFRSVDVEKLLGLGQTLRAVDDGVFLRNGWQNYFTHESASTPMVTTPTSPHGHGHNGHGHRHIERTSRPLGLAGIMATAAATAMHLHHSATSNSSNTFLHPPVGQQSRSRSRSALRALRSPSRNALFRAPDQTKQPLIIGDCSSDSLLWSLPISLWTAAGVARRLKAICQSVSKTSAILRTYDISSYTPDDEIMERVLELVNDARVAWPTQCVADSAKRERGGRNVWRYVFDQEGPSRGMPHHAADLMYLFDTVPLPESAFAASADMDVDAYSDVSYDEGDLVAASNAIPHPHGADVEEHGACSGADAPNFSHSSFVEKCEQHLSSRGGGRSSPEEDEWLTAVVDEYSYARVRDAMQERWISFAHGEAPWREDKVFVFGPEGETGERSKEIFNGRRRKQMWKEALEPLGASLVQKFGVELSRGPALGADRN